MVVERFLPRGEPYFFVVYDLMYRTIDEIVIVGAISNRPHPRNVTMGKQKDKAN
jgi:hypothetical protein